MTSSTDDTFAAGDAQEPAAGAAVVRIGGELETGSVIADRYEVQALIGRGGMGAVYRVHDRKLDEVVALKLMTQVSEVAEERFLREVRVARKVTHGNVARTHDLGEHEGVPFLSMEFVPGESLEQRIDDGGKLDIDAVRRIGSGIADGLFAAHEAGVVHRDLKPANVLIADDGRVVLTDFGIARMVSGDGKHTGGLIGTPHYMAPEQVAGKPTDGRADIYALGLILFEMATAELPFGGDTPISIAVSRLTVPPKDPRSLAPVDDSLARLILKCLSRDPGLRPQTAEAVRVGLNQRSSPAWTGTGAQPSLYAPIDVGVSALAVLPFAYRGNPEHDYLGEGLAEELVDVLSRTKGLKVIALGATRRFAKDRDPAELHAALGADTVVDGTVQLSGSRVRLSARLLEPDGVQRWSDRFDGRFEDVFELQESLGRRVAEALRLELTAASHRKTVPQEALELYLRARHTHRASVMTDAEDSVADLARAIELAPGFGPAISAHAIACIRAWWSLTATEGCALADRARAAVEQAQQEAPALAETHLATAMYHVQVGRFREAAAACADALEIAPTMPEAHHYLGELQLEAGRAKEGRDRLELTLELDPTLHICHLALARHAAFRSDDERLQFHIDALERAFPSPTIPVVLSWVRWKLYRGDLDEVRRLLGDYAHVDHPVARRSLDLYRHIVGLGDLEAAKEAAQAIRANMPNQRFGSLMLQLITESFAAVGENELAMDALLEASNLLLIDIEWIKRCPLLKPLHADPRYEEARARVHKRAMDIWRR